MDESARYNVGSVQRNINVPTMALTFLRGPNQARSQFKVAGRERVGNVEAVILSFEELAAPTIIRSGDKDLPASGRFWVDPDTGRVVKTELSIKASTTDARVQARPMQTKVTVTYAPVPKLTVWAPLTMKEEYGSGTGESIACEATYSNFRQFTVSTSVSIKKGGGGR